MRDPERIGAAVLNLAAVAADHGHHRRVGGLDGHDLPESGDYWFPGGLATVHIDRERDRGSCWEPSIWMRHTL